MVSTAHHPDALPITGHITMGYTSDPPAEPKALANSPVKEAQPAAEHARSETQHASNGDRAAAATTDQARGHSRGWLLSLAILAALSAAGYFLFPVVETILTTVSTDDAYVNGHVTYVAPRVAGQVQRVLVDDNYRVKLGARLVQLDKEPYKVQVAIKRAAVGAAEADLNAARSQVRSIAAQARANRFMLLHAIEDVNTQVANLRANVATLNSRKATLELARANLTRGEDLVPSGGISKEELDQRRQSLKVQEAAVDQALQAGYATRVGLGLAAQPGSGHELGEVPPDLEQNYSAVRQALGQLLQAVSQLGYSPKKWEATPKEAIEAFYRQDPQGNIDRILAQILTNAPAIKQSEAHLVQARADLDQALLNLRYCDIVSEIDGVVTRRNVNPGNNVAVGQSLMAIRSLTEIWIDANFKETQLADLRIGHPVRCEVDMYGSRREYEGRITGFTMGTGQTLALLPPQNATGNFVKIVQRLPVRIELNNYDPDKDPLFVGLSVVPYVYYKRRPTGPHAGEVLQPVYPLPQGPAVPNEQEASRPVTSLLESSNGP
jgi:membrane fusion protein (multidrug efflux system)